MRVLFVGDMSATGFGTVTMDLGRRMLSRGLDVRFLSQNDLEKLPDPFAERTLNLMSLVMGRDPLTGISAPESSRPMSILFEEDSAATMVNGDRWGTWSAEAVLLLGDIQSVRFHLMETKEYAAVPQLWHYCPVEGRELSPLLGSEGDIWDIAKPVAMSNFGADEIEKAISSRPPMIYHGVDTAHFYPVKPSHPILFKTTNKTLADLRTKDDCKAMWAAYFQTKLPGKRGPGGKAVPTDKWMLRTDRHMPRKQYNAMLRSLVPVLASNPDAIVILHCNSQDQGGYLPDTIFKLPGASRVHGDCEPGKPDSYGLFGRDYGQIIVTNLGFKLEREALCSLYNASDLYLSTSAEGFGLTIAEAMACGVPVVGLDYSAVPEVIGPAGVVVPPAYEFDNQYDHFWAALDEQRFAEAVHALLNDPAQRETLGRKGPRHVRANFSWDTAATQFADLLQANAPVEVAA